MPLAADTNVLARNLVDDGSEQSRRARQCFAENEVYVSDTVLLETEWLLRSRFKFSHMQINDLFSALLSSEHALFENITRIATAVLGHRKGLDFADAMHLVASQGCDSMVTYDQEFIRSASLIPGSIPVREP